MAHFVSWKNAFSPNFLLLHLKKFDLAVERLSKIFVGFFLRKIHKLKKLHAQDYSFKPLPVKTHVIIFHCSCTHVPHTRCDDFWPESAKNLQ